MIKVVHIIADAKFISQIEKFNSSEIDNTLVYLGDKKKMPANYASDAHCVPPGKEESKVILHLCSEAQVVVVYTLFPEIILKLSKEIKIIWRFFGVELYEKTLPRVLSSQTYRLYRETIHKPSPYTLLKKGLISICPQLSSFNRAVKRVNYFLGVFEEEYDMLISWGFKLPPFLQVPIRFSEETNYIPQKKENTLLLGNSRTFFNNHIDILRLLGKTEKPSDLNLKMFFSYGAQSAYTDIIREEALKLPQMEVIEQFLSKRAFIKIYQKSAAVLINSYRQMALGNIFIALQNGTKIYLSEKNITLRWLRKKGFRVSSIEKDFQTDLRIKNLQLKEADRYHNFLQYQKLVEDYSIKQFQAALIRWIQPQTGTTVRSVHSQ